MIGEVLVLFGAALTLVAALGMVRFDDVFVRMHSLSKATTLGLLAAIAGAAVSLDDPNDVTSLVLAGVLQLVTGPVAANALSRATYRAHLRSGAGPDADEGAPRGDALDRTVD